MTRFTYLGHAGFQVVRGDVCILLDPWGPDYRPFLGTWRQWPANETVFATLPRVRTPTHLWCSHLHGDHFDPAFLAGVDKNARVLLPSFPGTSMRRAFEILGFTSFIELGHLEAACLGQGVRAVMVLEQPEHTEHASLYLETPDGSFFHNADTSLNEVTIRRFRAEISREVDVFFGQHADPSPFPHVMDWETGKKDQIAAARVEMAREGFRMHCRNLGAKYAIPGAGPALITTPNSPAPSLARHFTPGGPYDFQGVEKALSAALSDTQVKVLLPGDAVDLRDGDVSYHGMELPDADTCRTWMHAADTGGPLAPDATGSPEAFPAVDDQAIFAARHSERFLAAAEICPRIFGRLDFRFDVRFPDLGLWFSLDFARPSSQWAVEMTVADQVPLEDREHFTLTLGSRLWNGFLQNLCSFDDINFSRLFTVGHSGQGFSIDFIQVLKCMHDEALLRRLETERLPADAATHAVMFKGRTYRILSHCPHQGMCLMGAEPDAEGVITCPGHGWKFSVLDGACVLGDRRKSIKAPAPP